MLSTMREVCRVLAGAAMLCATAAYAADSPTAVRLLYAVNQASDVRGSISIYDIDAGHKLVKTIKAVSDVRDVRGAVASVAAGRIYVTYLDGSGAGKIFCLDLNTDRVVWDKAIPPGVDRLAIDPNGRLLYVPTWEGGNADFINVVDAGTGEIVRRVHFSRRSHDAQYPLLGPLFQETKAEDGSGAYLYSVNPQNWAVSRYGPFSNVLGPYAVDSASRYVVTNVTDLWGMQVADLTTGRIITARLPDPAPAGSWLLAALRKSIGLPHGIGWTPDQGEVWQNSTGADAHVYIWDMTDPMAPALNRRLSLRSGRASHWLTFTIRGDYAYIAPPKNSSDGTEIFDVSRHVSVGTIGSSEDMLEIDFADGKVIQVGDQYGIGRK